MSRTKEIEVWVDKNYENYFPGNSLTIHSVCHVNHQPLKAKLIIELPEKKIEITESQFDEAVKEFFKGDISPMQTGVKMQSHLKQKLFGDVSERLGERT